MTFDGWLTFVVIWTIAGLPLGPNAVHTIDASIRHGYPKCLLAPVGMAIACIIHASIAALGVGAILLLYPDLFTWLKGFGAAYLAWLGIKLWRSKSVAMDSENPPQVSAAKVVISACVVSLVNPKAILSYVAIFTPFISANQALLPQLMVLLPTATIIVFLNYLGYSLLAWPIRRWMDSAKKQKLFNRIAGSMFIGFAGLLVFAGKKSDV